MIHTANSEASVWLNAGQQRLIDRSSIVLNKIFPISPGVAVIFSGFEAVWLAGKQRFGARG